MAAKKKSVARKKTKSKAMVSMKEMEAQLALDAQAEADKVQTFEGMKVSVKGKRFTFQGQDFGDSMNVIILDNAYERCFYEGAFDEENPSIPVCFSIADSEEGNTTPHPDSVKPQAEACSECDHDVWGSAETGKGKACSAPVRMLVLDEHWRDYNPDNMGAIATPMLIAPTSSLGNWRAYLLSLSKVLKRPAFAVVTKLEFDHSVAFPKLTFTLVEAIDDPQVIQAIRGLRDDTYALLRRPYDASNFAQSSPKKKTGKGKAAYKKKTVKKKVGKKKVGKKKVTKKKPRF